MIPRAVPPSVALLTREDARELLAPAILALCEAHGPSRVGRNLGGIDPGTIRDARDEKSSLCLENAFNLLTLDPLAVEPLLKHFHRRSVPIGSVCDSDALPAMTGAVHQLVIATSPTSDGGADITGRELCAALPALRAASEAIEGLINRAEEYLNRGRDKRTAA